MDYVNAYKQLISQVSLFMSYELVLAPDYVVIVGGLIGIGHVFQLIPSFIQKTSAI